MKKYINIDRSHAVTIQRNYCCAACWNRVMVGFDKDGDWIDCGTDDCRLPGLVSAKWVEQQAIQNEADAITARRILADSIEWLKIEVKSKTNREQLISSLGF